MVKLQNLRKYLFLLDLGPVAFSYTYTVTANLVCILRVILNLVNFEHDDYNEVRFKCHLCLSFRSLDNQTSLSPPVVLHVILWLDLGNPPL